MLAVVSAIGKGVLVPERTARRPGRFRLEVARCPADENEKQKALSCEVCAIFPRREREMRDDQQESAKHEV
jgi:hypothetical protein